MLEKFNDDFSRQGSRQLNEEATDSIDLNDDSGADGTVVVIAVVAAIIVCICCGVFLLMKGSDSSDAPKGTTEPDSHAVRDTAAAATTTAHSGAKVRTATGDPLAAYAQGPDVHAAQYSQGATAEGMSGSGRPTRGVKAEGKGTGNRPDLTRGQATSLAEAVFRGNAAAIANFTRDINEKVQGSFTALYIAARNNDVASAKQLLLHGADVNACTRGGSTALCRAAQSGNAEVLKVILEHPNVEINKQRGAGRTALFLAVQNGHQECVQLLLDNGAAVDLRALDSTNQRKWTAQQFADQRVRTTTTNAGSKMQSDASDQTRYDNIAAMLQAASMDEVQSTSPTAVILGHSHSETAAPAASGAEAGAGGLVSHKAAPNPVADQTTVRGVPVVPHRDHGDMDDSASDDSDAESTSGSSRDRHIPAPTENKLASLMSAGVIAATADTHGAVAGNTTGGARLAHPVAVTPAGTSNGGLKRIPSQPRVAVAASGATAPVVPPRAETQSTIDTSSSDSERCEAQLRSSHLFRVLTRGTVPCLRLRQQHGRQRCGGS